MKEMLTFCGHDHLHRPLYKDAFGRIWKDTDPRAHVPASLYSVAETTGNRETPFRGTPKFVPKRVTW